MILKFYFLASLLLVIVSYYLIKESNLKSGDFNPFSNSYLYSIVISASLFVGINYNLDYQLFCNPVKWTYWFLIPVFLYVILLPHLLRVKILKPINSLLHGVALFVWAYVLLFGGTYYLIMLLFVSIVGIPIYLFTKQLKKNTKSFFYDWLNFFAFVFAMPLFLFWILIKNLKNVHWTISISMLILIFTFSIYTSNKIVEMEEEIISSNYNESALEKYKADKLDRHLLELVLGAHWKYHTRMSIYDGWRPPFHDPLIGIRRLLKFETTMINYTSFRVLQQLYEKVFPENKTTFDCRCAKNMVWRN